MRLWGETTSKRGTFVCRALKNEKETHLWVQGVISDKRRRGGGDRVKVPLCSSVARAYGDSEMPNYGLLSACLEPVEYCRSPGFLVLSMVKSHC